MPGTATSADAVPARSAPVVVLADDDEGLREALTFALEVEGYVVRSCETSEQLLQLPLPPRAACLVIDYRLDALNGLDALEQLRRRGNELPAILITSFASPFLRSRAERLRADVIEKPLTGDALLTRLRELLPPPP